MQTGVDAGGGAALVIRSPSSTNSTLRSTIALGYSRASSSACIQWVVQRRPSEQPGGTRDERAGAHRQDRRAGGGRAAPALPAPRAGTTRADRDRRHRHQVGPERSSSPWSGTSCAPTLVLSAQPGCGPQTLKSKLGTPSLERSMPKTSQMTPNSNTARVVRTSTDTLSMAMAGNFSAPVSAATEWLDMFCRKITAMTALITFLLLSVVLVAPFGVVAAIAAVSYRDGTLRLNMRQFAPGRRWSATSTTTIATPTPAGSATTATPSRPLRAAPGVALVRRAREREILDRRAVAVRRVVVDEMTGPGHLQVGGPIAAQFPHPAHLSGRGDRVSGFDEQRRRPDRLPLRPVVPGAPLGRDLDPPCGLPCNRQPVDVRSNASRVLTGDRTELVEHGLRGSGELHRQRVHPGLHGPVVRPTKSGAMSSTTRAATNSGCSAARHQECRPPIE